MSDQDATQLDRIERMVSEMHRDMYGNGRHERGLIVRMDRMEQHVKRERTRAGWIIPALAASIGSAVGAGIVGALLSLG